MRLSFTLSKTINTLFINDGILGVIYGKNIDFLNLLGGNSVLITCFGYNTILNAVMDNLNNLLITYDSAGNIVFYDIKLSISRVNSNECYPMRKINTFPIFNENNKSHLSKNFEIKENNINVKKKNIDYFYSIKYSIQIEIFKNILFLMKENKYLLVLDLTFNQKNPDIENIIHYKEFLINSNLSKKRLDVFSMVSKNVIKREHYVDFNNDKIFKFCVINKQDIFILSKMSDFDLNLFTFSKENFLKKNTFLPMEYFYPYFYYLNKENKENYHLHESINVNKNNFELGEKMDKNDLIGLNIFNLNITKIKEEYLFEENGKYILKMGNPKVNFTNLYDDSINIKYIDESNSYLKNNIYYKLFYSNITSIVVYSSAIIIVFIFTFVLRLYYTKKQEEKKEIIKQKMEELQELNLKKLKGNTNLFDNNDNLDNRINKSKNSTKKVNIEKKNISKNKKKLRNSLLNIKEVSYSSEEEGDDFSQEDNVDFELTNEKTNVRKYIKKEKTNLEKFDN